MEPQEHHALDPHRLAQAVDRFIEARWRGEEQAASCFASWFEAHWTEGAPPEPNDPPDAASLLAGSGGGIRWYQRDDVIRGYVARQEVGCYLISRDDDVPPIPAPWDVFPNAAEAGEVQRHDVVMSGRVMAFRGDRRAATPQGTARETADATDAEDVVAAVRYLETVPAGW
jgi:hypothetical protein